ncbi:MAG: hypothetical protein H7318_07035 [Oligoflexus sp.]|nr:hypothetical protein [Oligoflexus sp.]
MKLSRLKLSLISLFLWETQICAQTLRSEGSAVGVVPLVSKTEEEAEIIVDPFAPQEDQIELRSFKAVHSDGYRQAQGEVGQVFDAANINSVERNSVFVDQRLLYWDLGISSDYSGTIGTRLLEGRVYGSHRLSLELAWNGRAYRGDGAGLEEIYQAASRLAKDFTVFEIPKTQRTDGTVRAADSIRIGRQSSFAIVGEFHQDHYLIQDALDDGSVYEAGTLRSQIGLGRDQSLETTLKRSVVLYRDHRNHFQQGQDLNEGESQIIQPLSAHYLIGVGLRSFDGDRNGPLLTLTRKPDERANGQLKVSYLSGNDYNQLLGSLRSQYLWTRQLKMTLNLEEGVDLLASYGSNTTTNQSRDREQKLSRAYEMDWAYEQKFSTYALILISNRQDFSSAKFTQQQARLQFDHRLNPLDKIFIAGAYRHADEQGQIAKPIDRRFASLSSDWRHYWGLDSRLFGAKSFGQVGMSYERLWEGERELERKSLSLALGQEWL